MKFCYIFNRLKLSRFSFSMSKPVAFTAFTLAEVLITLGIIGIVAEMTIPDLVQNTQNQEFRVKFKKEYSVLGQALMQISTDAGGNFVDALASLGLTSENGNANDSKLWRDLLVTKIKSVKLCDVGTGDGQTYGTNGCFGTVYKYYTNANDPASLTYYMDFNTRYSFVAADGAAFSVFQWANGNACSLTDWGHSNICSTIDIDVNGAAGPNKFGKDMFITIVLGDGSVFLPPNVKDGSINVADDCGGGADYGIGGYCSTKVIQGIDYK